MSAAVGWAVTFGFYHGCSHVFPIVATPSPIPIYRNPTKCQQHIAPVSVNIAVHGPSEAHPESDRAFATVHARLAAQPGM